MAARRTWSAARISTADAVRAAADDMAPAAAVEDLYAELSDGPLSALRVEMLHGQLPSEEKEAVMGRFVRRARPTSWWRPR